MIKMGVESEANKTIQLLAEKVLSRGGLSLGHTFSVSVF